MENGSKGNSGEKKLLWAAFEKALLEAQSILEQNQVLINEINLNQESKVAENLRRNVGLICKLNGNVGRVVELYAGISTNLIKSAADASSLSEGETTSSGQKRPRSSS